MAAVDGREASDERALFEAWAAAGNMHTGTLDHVGAYVPGTYADARLHTGWLAWQARAALTSSPGAAGEPGETT